MTDEIFDGIRKVFNHDNDIFLSPQEIYSRMRNKGFFETVEYKKAIVDIRVRLESPTFYRRIVTLKENGVTKSDGWALVRHFRSAESQEKKTTNNSAFQLQIGREFQRTISPIGSEIENGTIPLLGDFYSFFVSMDTYQQRQLNIDIHYYASENATCKIEQDDYEHWFLKSAWLREWYKENRIEPGDEIWLVVENITPLALTIYTEWERNPDTYRRYKLRQEEKSLSSVDLPISYIICEYFEKTQKIAHRLDIAKAVLEKRPEISEQSIYACLSSNPYLFVRIGEGNWGLKEWGLEQVVTAVRPVDSNLEGNPNLPTTTVPLDYILANIASENLVYRILENSSKPLTVAEITERISKILHVNKDVLARTTFFDPSDIRLFHRQEDGTFTLRKKIEELQEGIHKLAERTREIKVSLEEEINSLRTEIESTTVQHQKQLKQVEEERDILQKLAEEWIERHEEINSRWEKRTQLLSEFLTEAIPHIGQETLREIFEQLRDKSELRDANESG